MRNKKKGKVVRVAPKFGFVHVDEAEMDYFVPSRGLRGAMLGDYVLIEEKKSLGSSPEAMIVEILEEGKGEILGTLRHGSQGFVLEATELGLSMHVLKKSVEQTGAEDGEKVLAKIVKRGKSHFDHVVAIVKVYGDPERASVCADALLEVSGIEKTFPAEVLAEADGIDANQIDLSEARRRKDLRDMQIFTIDSASTKDIDDAISLERTRSGYLLGVHIADVSHYVRAHSALDKEAYARGNSLYYANQVVPMLPKELSNGICSLNPKVDRLAFSAFLTLDEDGKLEEFRFEKTVIRSQLKGVYEEINQILDQTADAPILKKYGNVLKTLELMKELLEKRLAYRHVRGSFTLDRSETKVILNEEDVAVDLQMRTRGISEEMIEEFMLLANEAAASFGRKMDVPFLYRVHEAPTDTKITEFEETLATLGVTEEKFSEGLSQQKIMEILAKVKGQQIEQAINYRVLRTMAKARYDDVPVGHYGLVLENYSHFTSPIRRYSDLVVHRVLGDVLDGDYKKKNWKARMKPIIQDAAKQTSLREVKTQELERDITDIFVAEYMKDKLAEVFDAEITGFNNYGAFVELSNTASGFLAFEYFSHTGYEVSGGVIAKAQDSVYRLGDPVRVVLVKAEVSSGKLDFVLEEFYDDFVNGKFENRRKLRARTAGNRISSPRKKPNGSGKDASKFKKRTGKKDAVKSGRTSGGLKKTGISRRKHK